MPLGPNHPNTSRQKRILDQYMVGVPLKVLAEEHGVHCSYPGLLAKRMGLTLRRAAVRATRLSKAK